MSKEFLIALRRGLLLIVSAIERELNRMEKIED